MRSRLVACMAVFLVGYSGQALSAVTVAEAERLKQDLTPVGAERAGNASGSIPEWTERLLEAPENWRKGQVEIDPYPEDDPLFVITSSNMHLYKDKLAEGSLRMLSQYGPNFFMPVYQTRRTAAFPEHVYDKFYEN